MKELFVEWNSGIEIIDLEEIELIFSMDEKNQVHKLSTRESRVNPYLMCIYDPTLSFTGSAIGSLTTFTLEYSNSGTFPSRGNCVADGLLGTAIYTLTGNNWSCVWTAKSGTSVLSPKCTPRECNESEERKMVDAARKYRDPYFRTLILSADEGKCVISGESQVETLETAHLHEVVDNGPDTHDNGIVLRKDLHALFDKRLITITADGNVEFDIGLSPFYCEALKNKQIPLHTLNRVREKLLARFDLDKEKIAND